MSERTLFIAWEDKEASREWYPVGRLDVNADQSVYRFRYTLGAKRAREEQAFPLIVDFPEIDRDYRAEALWALFRNRVIARGRPDFEAYLEKLDLPENTVDPIEILSANGGRRATDTYEVFPKLKKGPDGSFGCRFFLRGWRHVGEPARERLQGLKCGDELHVALELTDPATGVAVQIQTSDYFMLGWAPRYLVPDLKLAVAEAPSEYRARVVRVNPQPAPSRQRLLIEMSGKWLEHEPMTAPDFQPLVADGAEGDPPRPRIGSSPYVPTAGEPSP